jgi:Aldo/keto reductase family
VVVDDHVPFVLGAQQFDGAVLDRFRISIRPLHFALDVHAAPIDDIQFIPEYRGRFIHVYVAMAWASLLSPEMSCAQPSPGRTRSHGRDVVPAVNQIEVHPYFSQPQLRRLMAEHGIATQAWSPIGGVYAYGAKSTSVLEDPVVAELAAKHGKTPAQVVLRWHIEHGFCAIPKSVKPHRIAENIDIFDFQLTADEVAAINALDTGVRGGPDPASINPATYPYKVENDL